MAAESSSSSAVLAPAAPPRAGAPFWARAGVFVLLLAGAQLWINRHLGALDFDWWGVGSAIAAIVGALKVLDRYLEPPEQEEIKGARTRANSKVRWLILSWPFLALSGGVSLLVILTWSSILVVGDDGKAIPASRVTRIAGTTTRWTLRSHGRTLVPVTPFGRPYRLEVRGYLPRVVVVPPWTGIVLQASRDLERTSTVLVRLPSLAIPIVDHGGRLRVWRGQSQLVDAPTRSGAWMVGPGSAVDAERMAFWQMELTYEGASPSVSSGTILRWRRPERLGTQLLIVPGDTLRAEVCSRGGGLVAEGRWTVEPGDLTDVKLDWVAEEGRRCAP